MEMRELAQACALALLTSCVISLLIVWTKTWHGRFSLDHDLRGKQKFHSAPVPRVGGLAIMAGMGLALAWLRLAPELNAYRELTQQALYLLLAATPVFLSGLLEDLTKKVSVRLRFVMALAGAALAAALLGAVLPRLDLWLVDDLLAFWPLAFLLTLFAVVGVTNAVNIIDGFNGLAGSCVMVMLAGLGWLAWQLGDRLVLELAVVGVGAVLGFLLLNYPSGKLFLGDGGAYLLGFWCAELAVLLIVRNPDITPWQVLAIFAYPVVEVLYSIYRKAVVRRMSPFVPDRLHLHMLVYRRCKRMPGTTAHAKPWLRNCLVAQWVIPCVAISTLLAVSVGTEADAAILLVLAQAMFYTSVYTRLLRGSWCFKPAVMLGLRPEARLRAGTLD